MAERLRREKEGCVDTDLKGTGGVISRHYFRSDTEESHGKCQST
jgi:hypothetical protein